MGDTVKDGDYICFARGVAGAMDSLRAGVTTVRDVGSNDDCAIPLASAINRGIIPGANIIPAGGAIQGSYGHCPMIGFIANTEAQLIERIKRLKGYDIEMRIPPVHWAKIMASGGAAGLEDVGPCMYSPRELEALAYECHRLNMKVAAHALSYSNSPQSRSIIEAYGGTIYIDLIENFNEAPGYGVEVRVDGIPIRVGTRELMRIGHVEIPDSDLYVDDGATCVYVAITDEYAGCIVLSDPVREDAAAGIDDLRHSGVENIVMFSSDSRDRTAKLASSMGITEYYSECSRDKLRGSLSTLKQGCAPGRTLMYVGRGEDFGGSHTAADVDVAMSGADTLSLRRSCDVTILGGKVGKIAVAVGVARYARMLSYATAGGAALIKVILLILAAFGISTLWFSIFIDAIAAVAASLVSILAFSGELYK